mmetsp:Transcript_34688/g.53177  ORF Transcript_34688/g.53177 Transcript_34688/m.53177 type:complete len:226 (+) Transcript_34688:726-1403(+)
MPLARPAVTLRSSDGHLRSLSAIQLLRPHAKALLEEVEVQLPIRVIPASGLRYPLRVLGLVVLVVGRVVTNIVSSDLDGHTVVAKASKNISFDGAHGRPVHVVVHTDAAVLVIGLSPDLEAFVIDTLLQDRGLVADHEVLALLRALDTRDLPVLERVLVLGFQKGPLVVLSRTHVGLQDQAHPVLRGRLVVGWSVRQIPVPPLGRFLRKDCVLQRFMNIRKCVLF